MEEDKPEERGKGCERCPGGSEVRVTVSCALPIPDTYTCVCACTRVLWQSLHDSFPPICLHTAFFRICLSAHVLPHRAHLSMPMLGCNVETAVAIVANEQEQVFAAGLDQHLLQCRPRARVCKCAIVGVYVFVCMRGVGAYVCTCVCVRGTLRSYCIMSVNSRVSVCGCL